MTDAATATLALLCENQQVVRHPLEDADEVLELLNRMELRARLITDEEEHARRLTSQYKQDLDGLRQKHKEIEQELAVAKQLVQEQQVVYDLIRSFEVTGPVQFEGKEIIVKIENTRSQEREMLRNLEQDQAELEKTLKDLADFRTKMRQEGDRIGAQLSAYTEAALNGRWLEGPGRADDARPSGEPAENLEDTEMSQSAREESQQPEIDPEDVDMELLIE